MEISQPTPNLTMRTVNKHILLILCSAGSLAACDEELPVRTVTEYLDNPIMLEAAIVRCSRDRQATRYEAECVNARQAVRLIEATKEAGRQAEFDARSKAKRQALRRTQEAVAQARRRAAEAERLRIETEYLAQFGVVPPQEETSAGEEDDIGNLPLALIPTVPTAGVLSSGPGDVLPATDGGNAPVMSTEPETDASATDLESVREELQRRNEADKNRDRL